jgi:ATP-dependent DNA ligase
MRLLRIHEPFDHADFVFEPKLDGFRALAHIDRHRASLISRNGNAFKSGRNSAGSSRSRCAAVAPF